jgi:hypothetical protein
MLMCPKSELGGVVNMTTSEAQSHGYKFGSSEAGSVQEKYSSENKAGRRSRRPVKAAKRR